jgi:LysR family glycine cleavage system transcriptional activator
VNSARRLPPLNAVRAFDAAARRLSFKDAGEELNVTPGAISRHIVTLEDALGVKLFERRHRKVALTPAGEIYLGEIRPALERIALATSAVAAAMDEKVLRLKLPPTCAVRWLVPRLANFHARHPSISVQVTTSHDPVDFERDQIDAAVFWGDNVGRGLTGERLFGERLVPVCSPRLLGQGLFTPQQLTEQVLLHSFRRPDDWRRWFEAAGCKGVVLDRLLIFENSSLTYQGAIDGLGIALAQMVFITEELNSGRLVIASDHFVETPSSYYLTYPRERARLARIHALHTWISHEAWLTRERHERFPPRP